MYVMTPWICWPGELADYINFSVFRGWLLKIIDILMQSFRKYITYKMDYNRMLLNLLQEIVNRALRFEEIISGSASGLTHIDVKVDDLLNMVTETSTLVCLFRHKRVVPRIDYYWRRVLMYFLQAEERGISDLRPFFSSTDFSAANFKLDEERRMIRHLLPRH